MTPAQVWGSTLAVIGTLCVVAGCGSKPAAPAASSSNVLTAQAEPSSDVRLRILDLAGLEQLVAKHRGQVVVVDAWSTSCGPCIKEFPHLIELQKQFTANQLACVSLSFDFEGVGRPEDRSAKVLDFLKRHDAHIENVLSSVPADDLYQHFDLASVPAVFVYDRQGKLVKRFDNEQAAQTGAFNYDQVRELVDRLVTQPASKIRTAAVDHSGTAPPRR